MTGDILSRAQQSRQNWPDLISVSVDQIPVRVVTINSVILISSRKKINLLFVDENIFKARPAICMAVMTH